MRTNVYLILTRNGGVTMRKSPPELKRGEVAVKVKINMPDKFFYPPMPEVDLIVPEPAVITPTVEIEPEMTEDTVP